MLISTNELIDILRTTQQRAVPSEAKHLETVIDTLKYTGLVARADSHSSQRLRRIAHAHRKYLNSDVADRLESIDFFGIDLPVCDAFARVHQNRNQFIIFDGLLRLISFEATLKNVMPLLERHRPAAVYTVNGEIIAESLAFSLAGHALMMESIHSGEILLDISDMLGPNAKRNAELGYAAAIFFLLLHELGHVECGHMARGFNSERINTRLAIEESLSESQQRELEADAYAFSALDPVIRNPMISSVMFFLSPFAFSETFVGKGARTHPLSANRLAKLAETVTFPDDPELAHAVKNIVDAEIARYHRLAEQRLHSAGGILYKISETMPKKDSYKTIVDIRAAVKMDGNLLDMPSL